MKSTVFDFLASALEGDRPVALATVVAGSGLGGQLALAGGKVSGDLASEGSLGLGDEADEAARRRLEEALDSGRGSRFSLETPEGEADVFLEVHRPRPQLLIVGAVHTAIPLITFAKVLGFRTVVIDPRGTFATEERFGHADELLRQWPAEALGEIHLHEETYLATLSHDPKIDLPAVEIALRSPVGYVGALGSKKTHGKRVKALEAAGFSAEEIGRIHAPIGLDLGGRKPEEIALAVIAEIVAVRSGRRP